MRRRAFDSQSSRSVALAPGIFRSEQFCTVFAKGSTEPGGWHEGASASRVAEDRPEVVSGTSGRLRSRGRRLEAREVENNDEEVRSEA
jgi:hypothetical protein